MKEPNHFSVVCFLIILHCYLSSVNGVSAQANICDTLENCTKRGDICQQGNCKRCYYLCTANKWIEQCCTPQLMYNPNTDGCDHEHNIVSCDKASATEPTNTSMATSEPTTATVQTDTSMATSEPTTATIQTNTSMSTSEPTRCQLIGHCNTTGSFLPLGDCENCYCYCGPGNIWDQLCCSPGLVFNPNAWPNPNSCDFPSQSPGCGATVSTPSQYSTHPNAAFGLRPSIISFTFFTLTLLLNRITL